MKNIDTVMNAFERVHAADSGRSRPGQNIATSLVWSLAGQSAGLMAELAIIDHPDNPRRSRSPEAAADRTKNLEGALEERLALLGQFAALANPELMPEASQFTTPRDSQPQATANTADLAELTGMDAAELEVFMEQDRKVQAQIQQLRNEALSAERKAIELRLRDAMENVTPVTDDIQPQLAMRVLDKMAEKVDVAIQRAVSNIARTVRPRIRAELGGQVRVLRSVVEDIDTAIGHMEDLMDQRDEPGFDDRSVDRRKVTDTEDEAA